MNDPTYVLKEINENPEWKLAFFLSEIDNDNAPIGWFYYVNMAKALMNKYEIKEKVA